MGIWDVTFGYAALRTALALLHGWWSARHGVPFGPVAAQATSDLASVGVLAACVDYRVREALGLWALPLAAWVLVWEGWFWLRLVLRAADDEAGSDVSQAEWLGGWLLVLWRIFIVLPAVAASLLLSFIVLYPNSIRLPSERPPILCEPAVLTAADTLVIEMLTPHGGELLVTTPRGRTLTVVPFAAATVPVAQRFERQDALRLPVARASAQLNLHARPERVFQDTGTYVFQLNAMPDVGGALLCRTRLISAHSP